MDIRAPDQEYNPYRLFTRAQWAHLRDDTPMTLEPGEFELTQQVGGSEDAGDRYACAMVSTGGYVVLDTELTPALEAEGFARDLIRLVQDERRNAGLNVSDRIRLSLTVPADKVSAVEAHRDLIARETLAQDPASGVALVDVTAGPELAVVVAKF